MQTTKDIDGLEHSEIFVGKDEKDLKDQMDARLKELEAEGHSLISRKQISCVRTGRFKTNKQKKANIFQSRKLAR